MIMYDKGVRCMKMYKPNEFGKIIGVCVNTLQKWDRAGILKANRTPTNMRFYTEEHYQEFINNSTKESKSEV